MTERLYYTDAFRTSFTARVVETSEEGRRVYLDCSAFYPTSGGQPHDTGILGGLAVVDVVDEGDRVAHVLDAPLAAKDVDGTVDWARRFDLMQQHTGQHLLSAVFADLYGWETVSVHFGPDYATLDLAVDVVPNDKLLEAGERANLLIGENRPVTVTFEDAATAQGLRKPSDRDGMLRIVTIEGIDRSACGGTHVRATGGIGGIVLRRQEKMKKLARVEFLCGLRAARRARADYETLVTVATSISAGIDELTTLVPAQAAELRAAGQSRRKLEEELAAFRARAAWEQVVPGADGVRWLREEHRSGRADDFRAFAMAFAALPGAVYAARFIEANALLLSASADSGVDAGQHLRAALAAGGGKGGGSARLAQGSAPTADGMARAWATLGTTPGATA